MAKLNAVLMEFANSTRALARLLGENLALTAVDQLLIENHLEAIQLAYKA